MIDYSLTARMPKTPLLEKPKLAPAHGIEYFESMEAYEKSRGITRPPKTSPHISAVPKTRPELFGAIGGGAMASNIEPMSAAVAMYNKYADSMVLRTLKIGETHNTVLDSIGLKELEVWSTAKRDFENIFFNTFTDRITSLRGLWDEFNDFLVKRFVQAMSNVITETQTFRDISFGIEDMILSIFGQPGRARDVVKRGGD